MEEAIRDTIKEHNITQGKTAASCSGKQQSSDAMNYFNTVKSGVKNCIDEEDYFDDVLDRRLREVINERRSILSSGKATKVVHALMKIVKVTADVRRPQTIKNGYKVTGMYPVSYDVAMGQCQRKLTKVEHDIMAGAIPAALVEFRDKGCLSEEWMDAQGIINVNPVNTVAKDERALHQQRAVIFNHEAVQAQWDTYTIRNSAAVLEKTAAQKLLEKEAAAEERRLEKEKTAMIEKERKNRLTKEEKKEEMDRKKEATAQKRLESAQKKADKIAKAKQTLGIA